MQDVIYKILKEGSGQRGVCGSQRRITHRGQYTPWCGVKRTGSGLGIERGVQSAGQRAVGGVASVLVKSLDCMLKAVGSV